MQPKIRIAHLSGPTATIGNSPPLVTSNKARLQHGLAPRPNPDGSPQQFDVLRPQRLAAPATVYVECFSAHPLEADASHLYGSPDGYIDSDGVFRLQQSGPHDRPVFEVALHPEDGLYPLPYMARQTNGQPWEEECTSSAVPAEQARQGFYPDGSRIFEEIDRLSITADGVGNAISSIAEVEFFRVLPTAGYTRGLPSAQRTDMGEGAIPPEVRNKDFYAYKPYHLWDSPPRPSLARLTNATRRVLESGGYAGAIFTQGSPQVEETAYWFNLLLDTTVPICAVSAQRTHGELSDDGAKNLTDAVAYIASRVWADENSHDRAGVVVVQEQRLFAAREVAKVDARPGGYAATGGHGGILGGLGYRGAAVLHYVPMLRCTHRSEVNLSRLPASVPVVHIESERLQQVDTPIKNEKGDLLEDAIPSVSIVKDGSFDAEDYFDDPSVTEDLRARIEQKLRLKRLAGFVIEGLSPYGLMTSSVRQEAMLRAVYCGLPVVRVGRGNCEGFADPHDYFISGSNLTSTKARILLMAGLLRLGSLPPACDPDHPATDELAALREAVQSYQAIFDTH